MLPYRCLRVLAVLLILLSEAASCVHALPTWDMRYYVDRYYHANAAVSASQILGVPMPFVRGKAGDWRLSVSPAYVQVKAEPLKMVGGSLNTSYHRRMDSRWGLYFVALANKTVTRPTTLTGAPNRWLLKATFTGLDDPPGYAGSFAGDGSILTFSELIGMSYTLPPRVAGRSPITLFGGLVTTQSFARHLRTAETFTGTYGGGTPYSLERRWGGDYDFFFNGGALGGVMEFRFKHFDISPHLVGGLFLYNPYRSRTHSVFKDYDNGALAQTTVYDQSYSGTLGVAIAGMEILGFLAPGLDITYRDWSLGLNLLQPLGGFLAKNAAEVVLHGAWPLSIGITKHFGNFDK